MSVTTYSVESLMACRAEVDPLLIEHWKEIALNQDEIPLDVDWTVYEAMEQAGILVFISCRRDSALIGYSAFVVKPHPHYKSTVFAMNDVIFLKEEFRRGRIGYGLIKASENAVRDKGAEKISWHVKITNDWTALLSRMGYEIEEMNCGKLLR